MLREFPEPFQGGFTQFKPYVLNYFKPGCRETNAATEGLNNLIGRINISGNGYKFKHLRAKALYSSLFYTRVTYMLDMNSVEPWKPDPKGMRDITIRIPPRVIFSSREEDCSIAPVNVLQDNNGLDKLLAGDGDTVSGSLPEVDPDDILNVTGQDFVMMRLLNGTVFG